MYFICLCSFKCTFPCQFLTDKVLSKHKLFYKNVSGLNIIMTMCSIFLTCPSVQFSSVTQPCPTLCDPLNCSKSVFPVHHQLTELTQIHVQRVSDAIQPSHPLLSPSPPVLNLSHHQGLFKWVSSSHQVAKVLVFQLHHQSFQWIFRTDFL